MDNLVFFRQPVKKLGHDDVILVRPDETLSATRAVIARPQDHGPSTLRASCYWLIDHGDWLDQERARLLLRQLEREEKLRAEDDAWWARERHTMLLIGLFIVVLVVAIGVFDAAWGRHLAAGVLR